MDPRTAAPLVPLHLTSFAILSPQNAPLYVHSFTGKEDELRHYHLSHAALDVIEERIVMTSTPTKPADSYLGLLFCMEDMAFYGFQTTTKLRMVLSVALVDAMIKDADIVAIFRAVHQLLLTTINNPFLSLPGSFRAKHAPVVNSNISQPLSAEDGLSAAGDGTETADLSVEKLDDRSTTAQREETIHNEQVLTSEMFMTDPEEIQPEWLKKSLRFQNGMKRIGALLSGGRA